MEKNIGKEFMQLTKFQHMGDSLQKQGVPQPQPEEPVEAGWEIISLPAGKVLTLDKWDLSNLIEKRESLRHYAEESLSLQELAYLLWGTQGVKEMVTDLLTKRTVPSAGSRHPFETYLLVNQVEGLQPGLYRYLALEHQLARLDAPDDIRERLTEACLKQAHVRASAVTFIWAAVPLRCVWRYRERAYRYMLLDAGHVCQNLYLLAESIGCGVCAIAAYDDDLVNQALNLDGEEQFAIYLASLGRRPV